MGIGDWDFSDNKEEEIKNILKEKKEEVKIVEKNKIKEDKSEEEIEEEQRKKEEEKRRKKIEREKRKREISEKNNQLQNKKNVEYNKLIEEINQQKLLILEQDKKIKKLEIDRELIDNITKKMEDFKNGKILIDKNWLATLSVEVKMAIEQLESKLPWQYDYENRKKNKLTKNTRKNLVQLNMLLAFMLNPENFNAANEIKKAQEKYKFSYSTN